MNTDSRTVNSIRNIGAGFVGQILQAAVGFISRTVFINYLAVEYLGINGLFSSILSVLSLTELGVGTAFIYSLYKPLAEKNKQAIATIMRLYKKVYISIGIAVFILGLCVLPFLDLIIEEKPENVVENLSFLYLFFLFNTASTYFFNYKTALLNADQRNFITTINYAAFYILQNIAQIIVLIVTKNFIYYLSAQLIFQFLGNLTISLIVDRMYPFLKEFKKEKIDPIIKKQIISNAKATFLIRIGGVMVNNTDNIIVNYFSGLALLGYLTNYTLLIGILTTFIAQVFNNISASIAQVNAIESKEKQYEIFNMVNLANFWIYGFCSICIIVLMNDFIVVWVGESFTLPVSISVMLAINFFMLGMQNAIWTFKTTYGYFNEGKYLVILTAVLNLGFSFALGHVYGLLGILMATALSRLVSNFWYDPYIVFKLGLKIPPVVYLKKFLIYVLIITFAGITTYYIAQFCNFSRVINLIIKAVLCILIPNTIIVLCYKNTPEFHKVVQTFKASYQSITKKIRKG
ncbi:lipopolysaccharide biosynthesis protein [Aquimarina algicola]|uniref:Lipopolysaccharide biosynthesis protein n=1 Tax=Aquimarina algicola TaxID=2589995 RepID=A0A504JQK7_9FLAO|nr:lipopolysaccharide biosynthesis protein [Aquimarina algicola]TPN89139.1 lipopolysaccharide biosynthesis protein [Aquimarina algicola]